MTDDKKSLADQLRAKKEKEAEEQPATEPDKPASLADQLRAKKQAEAEDQPAAEPEKPASLADQLRAKKQAEAEDQPEPKTEKREARDDQPRARRQATAGKAAATLAGGAALAAALSEEAAAEVKRKFDSARSNYRRMHDRVRLTSLVRDTANLGSQITELPASVAEVRQRGYAFRAYLEHKTEVLAEQWREIDGEVKTWIANEAVTLETELDRVGALLAEAEKQPAGTGRQQQAVDQFSSQLEILSERVQAAEKRIRALFDNLRRETNTTRSQVDEINWYLAQKDEASFSLLPGEALFIAAEAEWDDGRKKPNGILFLTDQRLIFEQKEKTGKTLGLFGGQQTQNVLWETALPTIEGVAAENKGLFGGKDMLNFTLGGDAPYRALTIEVKGGARCREWAQQINRMVRGDASDERAIEPDPELVEKLRNAPTECEVCGAMLPQIMRGQVQVECRYCGMIVRL
jgi:hypothetical protein